MSGEREALLAELDGLLHHAGAAISVLGWDATRPALRQKLAGLLDKAALGEAAADPDCPECGFGLPRHDKDCSHDAAQARRRAMLAGINTAIRSQPDMPRMFPDDADDDWLYQ